VVGSVVAAVVPFAHDFESIVLANSVLQLQLDYVSTMLKGAGNGFTQLTDMHHT